ncbi:MAG TPA: glutamate--tRNA ligase family protein [Gemmatimonadales bacterium]|nr:glutamate--tRNA ligase family protein [Gemmatimonadales bacterium]
MSDVLPAAPLTRFAPSPTGYLHLGHVVNAIWTWGAAQALGGKVLLRMEDHDRTRCRPEYEAAILADLDWLGFEPDVASTDSFRAGPSKFRQSDSDAHYERALAHLREAGLAYVCECSRKDIAAEVPDRFNEEMRYPGTCRDKGLEPKAGRGWRVMLEGGAETFHDLRLGGQRQVPAEQCGDLLVRDRLGNWTYQFAVAVDDLRHGVDLVVRGEDLLESTGRQIRLAQMLGRSAAPRYLHHPLILKPSGEKLSKASGDSGLRELRESGCQPSDVLGRAAFLAGLQQSDRPLTVDESGVLAASSIDT